MGIYFISGSDTGIGKTVVTGLLARYLVKHNVRVITMKLVQTGNDGFSEDLDAHRLAMGSGRFPEDAAGLTAPQIFHFPASPHLAANLEGKLVDLERIRNALRTLEDRYDVVLAEAAGGLAVPLTEDLLTVDFFAEMNRPVILTANGKLGSLNHALMSIETVLARKLRIAGMVYNWCPEADPVIDADTPRMIEKYLRKYGVHAPLVRIPRQIPGCPEADFSGFFSEVRP